MAHLRRIVVFGVLTVVGVAVADWPLAAVAQVRPFYVSVTDSKGEPKADLAPADLVVEVNGKPAVVASLTRAAEPVSVVVVTEGIGRELISETRKMMKAVVAGARAIHPDSRVGLMVQDGAAAPRMHPVTRDAQALDDEIAHFFESSRNAPLLDSVFTASQILALDTHARHAIVAVTWGLDAPVDVMSTTKIAQAVRASGASLWVLDMGGRDGSNGTAEQKVLSDVTTISGGRRERSSVSSITPLTERIMATLRAQYAIRLEDGVPPRAASPRVSVSVKGLKVLAPAWPAER